ncbi:MAG: hypothetical protein ACKVQA_09300 [Burkholderiales bacterium]
MANQPKDAAERVQEGSVANWMDYYKRERGFPAENIKQERPPSEEHPETPSPTVTPKPSEQAPVR